ncbi:PelD GGDEF domain-containing protein [Vreelandella rituensis]|uniref:PelD GGDEF domain-containing protein n=1 Tax=Vreelandella rituensis TaxID=2282306 RepID=A0A368U681_9GAMM|nr:PelD GGDEF domain-containing protein [Halomonas rituensis]RCV92505.1 hypothetical protein DU506_07295 [Halomonas rituensis]
MATQIDDIRYQPPPRRTRVLESALLTLTLPVIGWMFHRQDPLFLDSDFTWLIIAPLLAGIRYGFVYGFSSALVTVALMIVVSQGWLAIPETPLPVPYAAGIILIGMIAGEFADIWQRRLMQMGIMNTAQATRLEEFVRHYHLLRVSHDQLAERLAATPHTLRDSLLQLAERFPQLAPTEDFLKRYAGEILAFFGVHGKVQQSALYRVEDDGRLGSDPLETYGGTPATPVSPGHAMIRACLQQHHMICLKSEMTRGVNEDQDILLAVVPLIDVNDRIWAIVTITEMPFIDYHRGQLHLLSVLGASLGDLIHTACERQSANEKTAREQFIALLKRWIRHAQRYKVHSLLITLKLSEHTSDELLRKIHALAYDQLRVLDASWVQADNTGSQRIHILLPLTNKQGAKPYCQRLATLLQERYSTNATDGDFVFKYQLIDGTLPASTLLRGHSQQESQHGLA